MPFLRRFRMNLLTDDLIKRNLWFEDLLRKWYPAGSQSTHGLLLGQDHLRLAIRDNGLHFYRAGWRVGNVHLPRPGELWSEISAKYVYGESNEKYPNVKVTSQGYRVTPGTANWVPYEREVCMSRWIANANNQVGPEKRFVDDIVTNNPNVIDLEVGIPAPPGTRNAPRMDLVTLEPVDNQWRIVFWETKRVTDGRLKCEDPSMSPKVVTQLQTYSKWLSENEDCVRKAFVENCKILKELHVIAGTIRQGIGPLGNGIEAIALKNSPPPVVDPKPRLLIDNRVPQPSFFDNGHLRKLKEDERICVRIINYGDSLVL